ncbi:hypothetical protein [Streptomyces sp. Isolate_45]|uniref:hypothetical protein n=1 Tax=Streptomyces sp. Isolate_45 TaxID=2950111 RepID=UPI002481F901|nr:hypothetical protein [Streptomyces sp. Isolate_45]MDA5284300.1 hypothetical protein [Streptomyces sp. Isolate_45]
MPQQPLPHRPLARQLADQPAAGDSERDSPDLSPGLLARSDQGLARFAASIEDQPDDDR